MVREVKEELGLGRACQCVAGYYSADKKNQIAIAYALVGVGDLKVQRRDRRTAAAIAGGIVALAIHPLPITAAVVNRWLAQERDGKGP